MSNVYIIENTAGTLSITLNPGALNGPGSAKRDTDLRLYGMGSLAWGKGVDENFLRIVENFACPPKVLGDYNPNTGLNDYDPDNGILLPRDEKDLGPGKGLNKPVDGQQWFNTTSRKLYIYDSWLETGSPPTITGGWKSASATAAGDVPPSNPQVGETFYNTVGTGTDSGYPEMWVYNPDHPEANEDGWVSILVDYISEYGGPQNGMKGDLWMTSDGGTTMYRIRYVDDPIDPYDAVNLHYMEEYVTSLTNALGDDMDAHIADMTLHLTPVQGALLDSLENSPCMQSAGAAAALALDICYIKGISTGQGDMFTELDAKLDKAGDTMTGPLSMGSNKVTSSATPSASSDLTNKAYVDSQVAGVTSSIVGSADRAVKYWSTESGSALDGDIHTSGGVVKIRAGGVWRQVFPPLYS